MQPPPPGTNSFGSLALSLLLGSNRRKSCSAVPASTDHDDDDDDDGENVTGDHVTGGRLGHRRSAVTGVCPSSRSLTPPVHHCRRLHLKQTTTAEETPHEHGAVRPSICGAKNIYLLTYLSAGQRKRTGTGCSRHFRMRTFHITWTL